MVMPEVGSGDDVAVVRCLGCHSVAPWAVALAFAGFFAAAAFFFFSIRSKSITLLLSLKEAVHSERDARARGPNRRARFRSMITRTPTTALMMAMATVMRTAQAIRMYIALFSRVVVSCRYSCCSPVFTEASSRSVLNAK